MKLNTIKCEDGSRKTAKRVGRGPGSGIGKTCGRGVKGQKSRSGGYHKVGFEGGQMPLQRRLPKVGFTSRKSLVTQEVRLGELNKVTGDLVTIKTLIDANILSSNIKFAKIMLSGEISRPMTIKGIKITKGAHAAVIAVGGKVEAE